MGAVCAKIGIDGAADPDRKGKVEAGIAHTQKTPLRGLRFETLDEAQAYLDRWDARWSDTRINGTTKQQVAGMLAEEQPALQPLPLEPFRYYRFGVRTVHLDGCVEVDAAFYGAPPGWIGRRVDVQWNGVRVSTTSSIRPSLRKSGTLTGGASSRGRSTGLPISRPATHRGDGSARSWQTGARDRSGDRASVPTHA
jgi:hypothetical protein